MCAAYLSVDWTAAHAQSQELRRRSSNLVISDAPRGRFQSAVCVGYTEEEKDKIQIWTPRSKKQKGGGEGEVCVGGEGGQTLSRLCSIVYLLQLALMLADGDAASLACAKVWPSCSMCGRGRGYHNETNERRKLATCLLPLLPKC